MFQFQIGAIRGEAKKLHETFKKKFQFQIGAIRGNSMLVFRINGLSSFNSKLVRLEARGLVSTFIGRISFNSKLVRLEAAVNSCP